MAVAVVRTQVHAEFALSDNDSRGVPRAPPAAIYNHWLQAFVLEVTGREREFR